MKESGPATAAEKEKRPITASFQALTHSDLPLIEVLADFNVKDPKHLQNVAQAAARCSHGAKSPAQLIGVLMWLGQYKGVPARFVMYLKTCYDDDLLVEEAVRAWHTGAAEAVVQTVPAGVCTVGAAEVTAMQASAKPFMDWLDAEEEESGSEEEDEED